MMEYVNVENISMGDERDYGEIEDVYFSTYWFKNKSVTNILKNNTLLTSIFLFVQAIFQYEDNIFERTNSDLSKAKLGYVIVSDNGAVICIKIIGVFFSTMISKLLKYHVKIYLLFC